MGVTISGIYVPTIMDVLDATQLALDMDAETHKTAMFTNSVTPNFSSDVGYGAAPYNAGEVTGTGYTAGGATLTGTTVTESPASVLMWDASDVTWPGSTIANARCAMTYAAALAAKNAIVLHNFGGDYGTISGVFTIQWAATGLLTIDLY